MAESILDDIHIHLLRRVDGRANLELALRFMHTKKSIYLPAIGTSVDGDAFTGWTDGWTGNGEHLVVDGCTDEE